MKAAVLAEDVGDGPRGWRGEDKNTDVGALWKMNSRYLFYFLFLFFFDCFLYFFLKLNLKKKRKIER